MKRCELIKKLEAKGWYLERHGANHDVYTDGLHFEIVPRHPDIKEMLAKAIIKKWNLV